MEAERIQKVDSLFQAALDLDPHARFGFLEEACGSDLELRREVESLVDLYQKHASFIEHDAVSEAVELLATSLSRLVAGQTFGHYLVVAPLGEGGMAAVYLARDSRL